jgi:hypothetical protein
MTGSYIGANPEERLFYLILPKDIMAIVAQPA